MFYVLSWFIVITLLTIWSLAVWALQAIPDWMLSNAITLNEAASGAATVTMPDWLAPWVPPAIAHWISPLSEGLAPLVDSLLNAAPALAEGWTVALGVIWILGAVLLMLLGAAAHLVIARWHRRGRLPGSRPKTAAVA